VKLFLDLQAIQGASSLRGIGRYAEALAKAILRNAEGWEIWLGLSDRMPIPWERIEHLRGDRIPADQVVTIALPASTAEVVPSNKIRARAAEWIREVRIADLRPDVVFLSSLFEGYVEDHTTSIGAFESGLNTAVTLYDLIPLLRQKTYLHNDAQRDWYFRKIESLACARRILAISESTRREAIDHLGIPSERLTVIHGGVDDFFVPVPVGEPERAELAARYRLDRNFILYVGNTDVRKNVEGIIASIALLPEDLRNAYQLALVCPLDTSQRQRLRALAEQSGLRDAQVVFTGSVPDRDLRMLYSACKLFVFPSLHEGLGLPILEAMACGAPVIGSDSSSVPEVIGRPGALFDASNPSSIAAKIHEVLTEPGLENSLRSHGAKRVRDFTWDKSARLALGVFSEMAPEETAEPNVLARSRHSHKPRLAYFTPLPPERSGISDYSAELLPALAEHYDIDVVVMQNEVDHDRVDRNLRIRTVEWFEANGKLFDTILYNIGNSPFHTHMFALMESWPGTVILHDFYLSHLFRHLGITVAPERWIHPLYQSHGLRAVRRFLKELADGRDIGFDYPCSLTTIRGAVGTIVHSMHARDLARRHFGENAVSHMRVLPFPRSLPREGERIPARRRLGLSEKETIVCSFGHIAETKLVHRIIDAWRQAGLDRRDDCRLIFVGRLPGNAYADEVRERCGTDIRITGFAEAGDYQDYLAACDIGVQLRVHSRGETSASAFDCLVHGVPLIVNAHGSMTEFPERTVLAIPDEFTDAELATALSDLVGDPGRRRQLAERALDHARLIHDPRRVAQQLRDAIEAFEAATPNGRIKRLIEGIGGLPDGLSDEDQVAIAESIAWNGSVAGPPQMLVDLTVAAESGRSTGIERVARNVAGCLTEQDDVAFRVELVTAQPDIRYARRFAAGLFDLQSFDLPDAPAELSAGDIFLGLDWNPKIPEVTLELLRQRNVRSFFVLYDMIPVLHPDLFPSFIEPTFRTWLERIVARADGILCISRSVADELWRWLKDHPPVRHAPLPIGVFPLGSDLGGQTRTPLAPEDAAAVAAACASPAVLMVGTIEPRKGYDQTLAAFEELWRQGAERNLVIVGRAGWMIDKLLDRLRSHPEAAAVCSGSMRRTTRFSCISTGRLRSCSRQAAARGSVCR
jgi:glycosyltransferase involved in cell wall biosynthesis